MEPETFPSWRYGPNNERKVYHSAADVPPGWVDTPDKLKAAHAEAKAAPSHAEASPPPAASPEAPPAEKSSSVEAIPSRADIAADLQRRGVAFHRNTPTKKLWELLCAEIEKSGS